MTDTKPKNRPSFALFSVKGEAETAEWPCIGAAWPHKDGDGYAIKLDSVPLTGRIVMRREKAEKGGAQ